MHGQGAIAALLLAAAVPAQVGGHWDFSVELENGQRGEPVFVLVQQGGKLSGTYRGPFGEQEVTGTVDGAEVQLTVQARDKRGSVVLTYQGKLLDASTMAGTMTRDLSGVKTPGRWRARRR